MNYKKRYNNKINVSGNKMREIRKEKGLSIEGLSRTLLLELGIELSAQAIGNIEHGTRTIVDYELWGIAKILKVHMEELIDL